METKAEVPSLSKMSPLKKIFPKYRALMSLPNERSRALLPHIESQGKHAAFGGFSEQFKVETL